MMLGIIFGGVYRNCEFGHDKARLLPSSSVSPNPARANVPVTVVLNVSESLADTPQLVVSPDDIAFNLNYQEGNTWSFTCVDTSNAQEDQDYSFSVNLVDRAGNQVNDAVLMDSGGQDQSKLSIDRSKPELVEDSFAISRTRVGLKEGNNSFTVDFTVASALSVLPMVTVSGKDMIAIGNYDPAVDVAYTFAYSVDGAEEEGYQSVRILLVDLAGNEGSDTKSNVVEYDFSAPKVATSRVSPNPASCHRKLLTE